MAIRPGMNRLTSPPPPEEEEVMPAATPPPGANPMPRPEAEPPGGPGGPGGLEGLLFQKMLEAGMDPNNPQFQNMDPKEVLQLGIEQVWDNAQTDENGELIEQIVEQYGLAPPWKRKELPMNNPDGSQTARGIQSNLDSMHDRGGWSRGDTPQAEKYTGDLVGPLYRANKMRQRQYPNNALTGK